MVNNIHDYVSSDPLHEDLQPYLVDVPEIGQVLKHPLLFQIPYTPMLNRLYNEQYLNKRAAYQKAITDNDIDKVLLLTERPYRLSTLYQLARKITHHGSYWEALAYAYVDCEYLHEHIRYLKRLFTAKRPDRDALMTEREHTLLEQLPDKFRVYRGYTDHKHGVAWTLSSTKAHWFANRWSHSAGKIVTGLVNKSDVLALFLERGEYEIVVDYRKVSSKSDYQIPKLPQNLQNLFKHLSANFPLGARSDHGPRHWLQVANLGIKICELTPKADPMVCLLFAILHDSQRDNECYDVTHGPRAALVTPSLLKSFHIHLPDNRLTKLCYAIEHHTTMKQHQDPVIGACFDSDRLDLIRVGTVPAKPYLHTKAAKNNILRF